MLTAEYIIGKIEQNRTKIRSFGVKKLILFGSYAKKDANPASDIDFLVEFAPGRGLFYDYIHLHQMLEDLFEKKIDLGEKELLREELRDTILKGEKVEAQI